MIGRRKILLLSAIGIGAFALVQYWPRRPVEIIPCVTNIDNADFNDPKKMEEFLEKAVPLQSDITCMKRVMNGKKFNHAKGDYINKLYPDIYGFYYKEKSMRRFKAIITLDYGLRQIAFLFKNGKLQKKVVH